MHFIHQLLSKQTGKLILQSIFWLPVIFFSVLLVINTIPYFDFSKSHPFIHERLPLFNISLYSFCFYTHIAAGILCITSVLIQFSQVILQKQTKLHIWSGRIYVFVVLLIAAPTGMFMSFFAKGSVMEKILFMLMAIIWLYTTVRGVETILKKNVKAHKQWMIRSYAMALTAVTFRIYHIVFHLLAWDHLANYEISLWISVLGNIAFAEVLIYLKTKNYKQTFLT